MKKALRFLSALLALLMLVPLAAACGQTGSDEVPTTAAAGEITDPEESSENGGYIADNLPDNLNFQTTLTFLYADDYTMTEFFAEEATGDAIDDAIFRRNANVESRLGVTLQYSGFPGGDKKQDGFLARAQADAQAGANAEYDLYAGYSRTIPMLQMDGLCANLLDTPYFSIEMPWWPKALTDELTIKNQLYFCTGDISTNLLWMMSALFFNVDLWNSGEFEKDPYEMVDANEWTLDNFISIVKGFYRDENGNGTADTGDIFGLASYNACLDAFQNSCGVISIDKDSDGNLKLADDYLGEKMVAIVEKCGTLFPDKSVHHSSTSATEKGIFIDGNSLFLSDGLYVIKGKDNGTAIRIELKYGLVPGPKFDTDQKNFVTNLRYPFNMYAISTMTKKSDAASAVLECLASESYRLVTPKVFEEAMKTRYSADSTTSRMYDILRDTVCFDLGRIYGYVLNNYYPNFRNTAIKGGTGWAGTAKATAVVTAPKLQEVMDTYN